MSDHDSIITVDELVEMTGNDVPESDAFVVDEEGEEGKLRSREWVNDRNMQVKGNDFRRERGGYRTGFGRGGASEPRQGNNGELASRVLLIGGKKLYIDIKDSRRGRFVKISEVSNGQKNRMTMEMSSAVEFHDKLTEFIDHYASLISSKGPKESSGQGKMMSDTIFANERRYYLDLKQNAHGRFLKIAMTMPPPSNERCDILIPAQGMVDVRDALTDLLNEFGKEEQSAAARLVTEKQEAGLRLKSNHKDFYFAVEDNKHGTLLRISEVCANFRTSVNVPHEIWREFREKLRSTIVNKSTHHLNEIEQGDRKPST